MLASGGGMSHGLVRGTSQGSQPARENTGGQLTAQPFLLLTLKPHTLHNPSLAGGHRGGAAADGCGQHARLGAADVRPLPRSLPRACPRVPGRGGAGGLLVLQRALPGLAHAPPAVATRPRRCPCTRRAGDGPVMSRWFPHSHPLPPCTSPLASRSVRGIATWTWPPRSTWVGWSPTGSSPSGAHRWGAVLGGRGQWWMGA